MKNIFLICATTLLLVSCGNRSGLEFNESQSLDLQQEQPLTFVDLKERILVPHCIKCHKSSGTEEGIQKWIIAGDPDNSKLYKVIRDGSMPKKADPLSTADLEFVRQYITDSFKVRTLETIDFETLKNEILVPHCLNCHKKMDNEESLQRWIDKDEPLNSRLLQSVIEGKMPKRADPLSQQEQNIITKYLNNFLIKESL